MNVTFSNKTPKSSQSSNTNTNIPSNTGFVQGIASAMNTPQGSTASSVSSTTTRAPVASPRIGEEAARRIARSKEIARARVTLKGKVDETKQTLRSLGRYPFAGAKHRNKTKRRINKKKKNHNRRKH